MHIQLIECIATGVQWSHLYLHPVQSAVKPQVNVKMFCKQYRRIFTNPASFSRHCAAILSTRWISVGANADFFQGTDEHYENAKPFNDIPGPRGLPYFGTLFSYKFGVFGKFKPESFKDAVLERYKQYGPIMKETINGKIVVHIFDPDYVKMVYFHEGRTPHVPPLMETTRLYREQKELSLGLGNSNGEVWYHLRSAVQQMMMRPKEVGVFLPLVEEVANDFISRMKRVKDAEGEIANFRNEMFLWTLESSAKTCFERRLGSFTKSRDDEPQLLVDANSTMFTLSTKLEFSVPWFKLFQTPTWKKLVAVEDFFFKIGHKYVDETIATIKKLVDDGKLKDNEYTFMKYLLNRKELTYKDVSIVCLSLFGDGLNTTSPTMLYNIYSLASNPDVQQMLYQEIQEKVPRNEPLTPDVINSMSYLKACVKETFRFFPIGLDVSRLPQKNIVLGGYQIPAGTHISMNNYVMFDQTQYFSEPEKFLPERWLRGGTAHEIHPYTGVVMLHSGPDFSPFRSGFFHSLGD